VSVVFQRVYNLWK